MKKFNNVRKSITSIHFDKPNVEKSTHNHGKFKFVTFLNIFLTFALLITLGARFYYSDKASIAGSNLSKIENEITAYHQQNEYLKNQYLTLTSLSVIKPLALENGYVEANVEYYTSPELAAR